MTLYYGQPLPQVIENNLARAAEAAVSTYDAQLGLGHVAWQATVAVRGGTVAVRLRGRVGAGVPYRLVAPTVSEYAAAYGGTVTMRRTCRGRLVALTQVVLGGVPAVIAGFCEPHQEDQ